MNAISISKFKQTGVANKPWGMGCRTSLTNEVLKPGMAVWAKNALAEGGFGSGPAIENSLSINKYAYQFNKNFVNNSEPFQADSRAVLRLIQCSGKTDAWAKAGINTEQNLKIMISLVKRGANEQQSS